MLRTPLARSLRAVSLAALASASLTTSSALAATQGIELFRPSIASGTEGSAHPDGGEFAVATSELTLLSANDPAHGFEPWIVNAAGDARVLDLAEGTRSSNPVQALVVGNDIAFTTQEDPEEDGGNSIRRVWMTAGPAAAPTELLSIPSEVQIAASGADLYISHPGSAMFWHLAEGSSTPDLVRDLPGQAFGLAATADAAYTWAAPPAGFIQLARVDGDTGNSFILDGDEEPVRPWMNVAPAASGERVYFVQHGTLIAQSSAGDVPTSITYEGQPLDGIKAFVPAPDGQMLIHAGDGLYLTDGLTPANKVATLTDDLVNPTFVEGRLVYFDGDDSMMANDVSGPGSESVLLQTNAFRHVTLSGEHAYFSAFDQNNFMRIYRTDGTVSGTSAVTSTTQFRHNFEFSPMGAAPGGGVLFRGESPGLGSEVFRTPSVAGDVAPLVADANTEPRERFLGDESLAFGDHQLLFSIEDLTGDEIWVSDGQPGGTHELKPGLRGSPFDLQRFGSKAAFNLHGVADDRGLYVTDGTAAGTIRVDNDFRTFTTVGTSIIWSAEGANANGDDRLFRYDGTGPPVELPDAWPGTRVEGNLKVSGTDVFYITNGDPDGDDDTLAPAEGGLWKLDTLTGAKTHLATYEGDMELGESVVSGGRLYAPVVHGSVNTPDPDTVWTSDGTVAGTHVLDLEARPGSSNGSSSQVWLVGSTVFAFVPDGGTVEENPTNDQAQAEMHLWRVSGTTGTRVQSTADLSFEGRHLNDFGTFTTGPGGLYTYNTSDPALGRKLIKIGATGAPQVLHTFAFDSDQDENSGGDPYALGAVKTSGESTKAYFSGRDDEHGAELWSTDGTVAGTKLEQDIRPGAQGSYPRGFQQFGDQALFQSSTTEHSAGLYSIGRTSASTPETPVTPVVPVTPTITPTLPTDNPATPGATPPADGDSQPAPVDTRAIPKKVSIAAKGKADKKAPFQFKLTGAFVGAKGLATKATCSGSATITLSTPNQKSKPAKTIKTFKVKLKWAKGKCVAAKTVTLPTKGLGSKGTVTATFTYPGSKTQQPLTSKPMTLRFGK